VEGPIATLVLDRPEALNALTAEMLDELGTSLERLGSDAAIRVIVLRGAGRAFSAGVDLKALAGRSLAGGAVGDVLDVPARRAIAAMGAADAIVVAAVHGFCFTGALELVLGCDICIASEAAVFADTHAVFGLRPSWGMSQRLPRAVGAGRARLLSYTGRRFTGTEAAAWGLAAEVVPTDRFEEALDTLASNLAANSRDSLIAHKRLAAAASRLPLDEGLRFEADASFEIADTEDRVANFR
jgi:enoyl-CoA hydratase/carnithine racemase